MMNEVLIGSDAILFADIYSKTAAIEKLMNYPDFKEWLLWNRP